LWEIQVVLGFFDRVDCGWKHRVGFSLHQHLETERAVYPKFSPRQVVPEFRDVKFGIPEGKVLLAPVLMPRAPRWIQSAMLRTRITFRHKWCYQE
jgi:hypothetical protein